MQNTLKQRVLLILLLFAVVGALAASGWLFTQRRLAECAPLPLLADRGQLLPNAALLPAPDSRMPEGWASNAAGVELRGPAIDGEGFDLDGDGRALQLIGINNFVQTPSITVQSGSSYCFAGHALTDSLKRSPTRLRVVFAWHDAQMRLIHEDASDWQPVVLWQADAVPDSWSRIHAAFRAPAGAESVRVRLEPSSDDRVYLDYMRVQQTTPLPQVASAPLHDSPVVIEAWPNGAQAALSFSFDWETAMGGLIHSRSADDPHNDEDYLLRGMRMREGVTTTLELFRPHGIRATYYANGYNFLRGNTEQRTFMGDPTFSWANTDNAWMRDWSATPWFADDPHGTYQSHPEWYYGDLIPLLQRERQDIQSHTFSHLHGGLASPDEWRADIAAWNEIAAEHGVPPARSLAFPWSSSLGLSDNDWRLLAESGFTSVTRTAWSQRQYRLFPRSDNLIVPEPHCRTVPGHPAILACPDFYLTETSAPYALEQLDLTIEAGGMIDLWAHTEEVVSEGQIAAWGQVVTYAAERAAAGELWIAPLAEIADWQQAITQVTVTSTPDRLPTTDRGIQFSITNNSQQNLSGLTCTLPFTPDYIVINGTTSVPELTESGALLLDLPAGETLEIQVW